MSSVMVKLLDKDLIVITGFIHRLILKLWISLISDFTDSFGKFRKHPLLLRLADRIVNFQNSFTNGIPSKHTTSIRH